MVGRQRDELLDVGVLLVPQLHAIRQILFISPHEPILEHIVNIVQGNGGILGHEQGKEEAPH